ncbi:guanine nucleotide exchange factor SPIKE 1 isoform X2 [Iris pallida]|uniref:Guanine nucleotide exchange factor SPIKE 1 isoform X2 n=1 Tax=Iris pallida TaxID=29817 RepID=A0AAX6E0Z0_IRIPA|nr:guanine nucleotide exchange factor SPIKE 1 isoform X2 [Iris pallida]
MEETVVMLFYSFLDVTTFCYCQISRSAIIVYETVVVQVDFY